MKRIIKPISFLSLIIILNCCSSTKYTVSEKGDNADIALKDGKKFSAEIIAINDSSIILSPLSSNLSEKLQLLEISKAKIKSITITGYDGSGWETGVLVFQALPAVLLGIAASGTKTPLGTVIAIAAIPAAITAMLFAVSDGTNPHWDDTMSLIDLNKLKIYSRYPENYTFEKQAEILKKYNQKSIKEID